MPPKDFCADWAETLIQARRTVLPKRLAAPGPDAGELERILAAASAAPDHGERVPWRFVAVPDGARGALAQAFGEALLARDPAAGEEQLAQAREKAFRSPVLVLAVARLGDPGDEVPAAERLVSAGCAIQNVLLMATALGYGSALTSGKALDSQPLRALFRLVAREQALCFINIGSTGAARRRNAARPQVAQYVSILQA
ncbi:MAG: nitroreductase family protein [Ramlibacter sp.]